MSGRHLELHRGKKAALPAALSLVCAACLGEDPIAAAPVDLRGVLEEFRESARELSDRDSAGGLTVAVLDGDKVIWTEGFSWADHEKRVKALPRTIYRIGSLTKTFTAVVLRQLVDKGVVNLDDPVENYLPQIRALANPPAGAKPITLRMHASHTAGLIPPPALTDAMTQANSTLLQLVQARAGN